MGPLTSTEIEHDSSTPATSAKRLWTMLAHSQGQLLDASRLATSPSICVPTVTAYIDLLVDPLLVRRLPPFMANTSKRLVKSPKTYVRDSGLVHAGEDRYPVAEGIEAIGLRGLSNLIAAS